MHDDSATHEWLAPPVLCDVAKHAMLNLVPFACARGKVTHRDASSNGISQLLQRHLPQADAVAVTASCIRRHEQCFGFGIHPRAHLLPPAVQRLGGKPGGIMINSYTHPSVVGGDIIDTIRNALAQTLVDTILAAHLFRLPLGMPCASRIFDIPDPCLFLRVHRYHRVSTFLKRPDLLVDMLAWRIAIAMRAAFLCLPIGLQALVQIVEQPGDGVVTYVVSLVPKCLGKVTGAPACPQQRRLRVPTDRRLQ